MTDAIQPAYSYRTGRIRDDGWTGEVQADFLEALAGSGTVSRACKAVSKAESGAYVLRHSARGQAFSLGWKAAHLIARDRLEDVMLDRAIEGTVHVTTRDEDGTITRRLHNHHHSKAVLERLDRRLLSDSDREARLARLVMSDFGSFLDLVASEPDDVSLWAWIEARVDPRFPKHPVKRPVKQAPLVENYATSGPSDKEFLGVWNDSETSLATDFPPPADFDGTESGEYGSYDYCRTLTDEEEAAWEILNTVNPQELAEHALARDLWFEFTPSLPTSPTPLYAAA